MLVKVIKLSPEEELIFFKKNYTLVYIQDLAFDSSRAMIFFLVGFDFQSPQFRTGSIFYRKKEIICCGVTVIETLHNLR